MCYHSYPLHSDGLPTTLFNIVVGNKELLQEVRILRQAQDERIGIHRNAVGMDLNGSENWAQRLLVSLSNYQDERIGINRSIKIYILTLLYDAY